MYVCIYIYILPFFLPALMEPKMWEFRRHGLGVASRERWIGWTLKGPRKLPSCGPAAAFMSPQAPGISKPSV